MLSMACGGASATAVAVVPKVIVSSVAGPGAPVVLAVGTRSQFSAVATDANGSPLSPAPAVTWQSTGPSAAVDSQGMVTAMSNGVAFIKASVVSQGGAASDSVKVTIVTPT